MLDRFAIDALAAKIPECWRPQPYIEREVGSDHFNRWKQLVASPSYQLWSPYAATLDWKMLYDSYLWRRVIEEHYAISSLPANVLEICPGRSFTIPVALASTKSSPTLVRLDLLPEVAVPPGVLSSVTWLRRDILSMPNDFDASELVVGNHVLDDLLLSLHSAESRIGRDVFSDSRFTLPEASQDVWMEIKESSELKQYIDHLYRMLLHLLQRGTAKSTLILREYPSTFALLHRDVAQVNVHRNAFSLIAERFKTTANTRVGFPDIATVNVPSGCKFPHSFMVVEVQNT